MHCVLCMQIPQLSPERMTMIGLNLFQHLSHLTRISNTSLHTQLTEDQVNSLFSRLITLHPFSWNYQAYHIKMWSILFTEDSGFWIWCTSFYFSTFPASPTPILVQKLVSTRMLSVCVRAQSWDSYICSLVKAFIFFYINTLLLLSEWLIIDNQNIDIL